MYSIFILSSFYQFSNMVKQVCVGALYLTLGFVIFLSTMYEKRGGAW